jgi:hypothetical protein
MVGTPRCPESFRFGAAHRPYSTQWLGKLVLICAGKMKLIDRFISRELLANVLFAIAVLSLVLVSGNISVAGKNFPGRALLG